MSVYYWLFEYLKQPAVINIPKICTFLYIHLYVHVHTFYYRLCKKQGCHKQGEGRGGGGSAVLPYIKNTSQINILNMHQCAYESQICTQTNERERGCYLQLYIWNTPSYLYMYTLTQGQIIRTSQIKSFPEGIHFLKFYS